MTLGMESSIIAALGQLAAKLEAARQGVDSLPRPEGDGTAYVQVGIKDGEHGPILEAVLWFKVSMDGWEPADVDAIRVKVEELKAIQEAHKLHLSDVGQSNPGK